jgi:hypothetical protein
VDDLTDAQRRALTHVRAAANARRAQALDRLGPDVDVAAVAAGLAEVRITLNFHPDRRLVDGRTVAQSLAREGVYRGQFETGISNGSRTAYPDGERDQWEQRLFGRAYHDPPVPAAQRPRYGALNPHNFSDGGSPRFGSCHVRLRPPVLRRATLTLGDSHAGPRDIGTLDAFESVLAGLVEHARATGVTLGAPGVDPVELLSRRLGRLVGADPTVHPGRCLDDYVEVQVHGPVELARDAEALVLDPAFADDAVGEDLLNLAERLDIAVEWHCGFELDPEEFDDQFRGPHLPPYARAVADRLAGARGVINAAVVGRAAASAVTEPDQWRPFGAPDELLQYVKHLWHTLVYCGRPAPAAQPSQPSPI